MLKVKECQDKITMYQHKIHLFQNGTPDQKEYTEHLSRLVKFYEKELSIAKTRPEPPIGQIGVYSHSDPRTGKTERGAYEIYSFNPRKAFI